MAAKKKAAPKKAAAPAVPARQKRVLVFDTETTGLLKPDACALADQPKIIEIALVELRAGAVYDKRSWLINPGEAITEEITKITGLKNEDLEGKPSFAQLLPEIADFFLGAEAVIAHNLPFDRGMLVNELRRLNAEFSFPYPPKQICTVQAFMHVTGKRMRQIELYQHVMGKPLAQTHRALDDAMALTEIVLTSGLIEDWG
jgi:DNA polymerase-3 subunit epsilon